MQTRPHSQRRKGSTRTHAHKISLRTRSYRHNIHTRREKEKKGPKQTNTLSFFLFQKRKSWRKSILQIFFSSFKLVVVYPRLDWLIDEVPSHPMMLTHNKLTLTFPSSSIMIYRPDQMMNDRHYFLRNEHPSVNRAFPPVGWQSTVEHPAHTTTVWACENTVVMVKQPWHLTSMKKDLGAGTRVFNLCFRASACGVGLRRSSARTIFATLRLQLKPRRLILCRCFDYGRCCALGGLL